MAHHAEPDARIQRPRRPCQAAEHDPSQRPAEKHAGSRTEHHGTALEALVLAGKVKSRADVLETLEKAGFEISRATPSSISIKNPDPKGRNIRLKGALYEQDFRFGEDLRADITHRSRQHRAANESRLRHATAKYQRGIEAKRAENNRRYTRPAVTHEQGSIQALSLELARHIGNRFDSRRDIAHSDIELQQRIGRSETAESRSRTHPRPVELQDERVNTGKLPGREQQSHAGMRSDDPSSPPYYANNDKTRAWRYIAQKNSR